MLPTLRTPSDESRTSLSPESFASKRLNKSSQEIRHRAERDVFDDDLATRGMRASKSPSQLPPMSELRSRRAGSSVTPDPVGPKSPGIRASPSPASQPLRGPKPPRLDAPGHPNVLLRSPTWMSPRHHDKLLSRDDPLGKATPIVKSRSRRESQYTNDDYESESEHSDEVEDVAMSIVGAGSAAGVDSLLKEAHHEFVSVRYSAASPEKKAISSRLSKFDTIASTFGYQGPDEYDRKKGRAYVSEKDEEEPPAYVPPWATRVVDARQMIVDTFDNPQQHHGDLLTLHLSAHVKTWDPKHKPQEKTKFRNGVPVINRTPAAPEASKGAPKLSDTCGFCVSEFIMRQSRGETEYDMLLRNAVCRHCAQPLVSFGESNEAASDPHELDAAAPQVERKGRRRRRSVVEGLDEATPLRRAGQEAGKGQGKGAEEGGAERKVEERVRALRAKEQKKQTMQRELRDREAAPVAAIRWREEFQNQMDEEERARRARLAAAAAAENNKPKKETLQERADRELQERGRREAEQDLADVPQPEGGVSNSQTKGISKATRKKILANSRVLQLMTEEELETLLTTVTFQTCPRRLRTITQGDLGDTMYCIAAGEVDIYVNGKWMARRGEGMVVGEVSIFSQQRRTATVVCWTPVKIMEITREALQQTVQAREGAWEQMRDKIMSDLVPTSATAPARQVNPLHKGKQKFMQAIKFVKMANMFSGGAKPTEQ